MATSHPASASPQADGPSDASPRACHDRHASRPCGTGPAGSYLTDTTARRRRSSWGTLRCACRRPARSASRRDKGERCRIAGSPTDGLGSASRTTPVATRPMSSPIRSARSAGPSCGRARSHPEPAMGSSCSAWSTGTSSKHPRPRVLRLVRRLLLQPALDRPPHGCPLPRRLTGAHRPRLLRSPSRDPAVRRRALARERTARRQAGREPRLGDVDRLAGRGGRGEGAGGPPARGAARPAGAGGRCVAGQGSFAASIPAADVRDLHLGFARCLGRPGCARQR